MKKEVANRKMVIKAFNSTFLLESIALPGSIMARLEGNSSLGRIGQLSYPTAGYIDPAWHQYLTLELLNTANLSVTLYNKTVIGQIPFLCLTSPTGRLHG